MHGETSQPPAPCASLALEPVLPLAHGENPYQEHAWLLRVEEDVLGLAAFQWVGGPRPCYTNMADADCLVRAMGLLCEAYRRNLGTVPFIAMAAKHGNPCGLVVDRADGRGALLRALRANARAIWGGEVALNFSVDETVARCLLKDGLRAETHGDAHWMLDLVLAPAFDADARRLLSRRKLLENPALAEADVPLCPWTYRGVRGGLLCQSPHTWVLEVPNPEAMEPSFLDSLLVAWVTAWTSNHGGNEVALAIDGSLLGVGGGPSTLEAVKTALQRARDCGHDTAGAVFAANAFFPFTDGPDLLIGAGVRGGIVPAGGKREPDVRALFESEGVEVVYAPAECRGFSRH